MYLSASLPAKVKQEGEKRLRGTKECTTPNASGTEAKRPEMAVKCGNKTIMITFRFCENSGKTLDDKVKKLIKSDIEEGIF